MGSIEGRYVDTPEAMLVRVLDLTEHEATVLRRRLVGCDGVVDAEVDAASGLVDVVYRPPCDPEEILAVLARTGRPVLTGFACC